MIVCPSCRNINEEDRPSCSRCGASLAPGSTALMPARRSEGERPTLEIQTPKLPSKWRPLIVLGLLVGTAAAVGSFVLFGPDRCGRTNFTSDTFGYCVLVPEGWEAGPARFGAGVTLDQFAPPTQATTVVVEAVDLESGTALEEWSAFVRARDEEAGLTPGETSEISLDGVGALQWDVTAESEDGEEFRMREVVVVRNDVGWRIALNDLSDGFDTSAVVFQAMLETWRFR